MTDRAVSSVLDVTVCLLLVSASALALTQVPQDSDPDRSGRADAALELVTTSTAWIEYRSTAEESNRTAHGTLAELLAASAATNVTSHGRSTAPADGFRRAVATEVRRAIAHIGVRAQVIARWRSSPDAHVTGRITVGPSPPPSTNVHAASTAVPWSPKDSSRSQAAATQTPNATETTEAISFGRVRLTVRTWSP